LSPAVSRELERHPQSSRAEILSRARRIASDEGRTLLAEDVQTAVRLITAQRSTLSAPASATPSLQTIPMAPGRRPLMPFKTLMWALYRDADFVNDLVGQRRLIAFNISVSTRKQHLVIWVSSIASYLANRPPARVGNETIMADIFPDTKASFPVGELAALFTTGRNHIKILIDKGLLQTDKTRPFGRGRGRTRWIVRDSIIQFLKNGRVS
jgi:hypothetical protein